MKKNILPSGMAGNDFGGASEDRTIRFLESFF
jgi:hypothetical protein